MSTIILSGCVKDTCNGRGNTFLMVELDSTYLDDTTNFNAEFDLITLHELPDSYFADVMRVDSITEAYTNLISVTSSRLVLTLNNSALPGILENKDYTLSYAFSDRQEYIECEHPGSLDQYHLELSFSILNEDGVNYELTDFNWEEYYTAGHL